MTAPQSISPDIVERLRSLTTVLGRTRIDEAADEIERLQTENWQLRQACGYPIPADKETPQNPFKCGICDARALDGAARAQGCMGQHHMTADELAALNTHWQKRALQAEAALAAAQPSVEQAKAYVDRAIASYVGDPADNQFQKGFLAALEVVRDEAFTLPSTEGR